MENLKKYKFKRPLPNSIPGLIEASVADARKIQKNPRYKLDMGSWHEANGKCAVCMAGAVIACRTNAKPKETVFPSTFNDGLDDNKLRAIDILRMGDVRGAYVHLNLPWPVNVRKASQLIYENWNSKLDRAPWHIYLRAAKILRKGEREERDARKRS